MRYVVLGSFFLLMILVGVISSRKIKTTDDYVIGGRQIGSWMSAFAYGTTYFSAVIFVGYAGRFGWRFGVSATWIGIGNALIGTLFAWLLLAEKTREASQRLKASTMAEFFRRRYDSEKLERFAAIVIFVFLIPYSASVYQGLGYVMQGYFQGTFLADLRVSMFLIALVTGLYLYFGGYISTSINSMIQGIIMTVGVIFMVIRVIKLSGGVAGGLQDLSQIAAEQSQAGALASVGGPFPAELITILLMTSLGTLGLPQMIAKYASVRDRATVKRATVMSTVLALIIGGGAYFIGGFSQVLVKKLDIPFDLADLDTLMPAVFNLILSPVMLAVLIVLMISASMSTLAAVVLVSAPTFARTILRRDDIRTMRILSAVFVFLSYLIAVIPSAIVTLMAFSWGAVSGTFIGPYFWGLYDKETNRPGAAAGMITGLSVVAGGALLVLINDQPIGLWAPRLAVLAMFASLAVTPLVSRLIKQQVSIKGVEFSDLES